MPDSFVPQIARAIGVLTSNSRGAMVASLAEGVVPWWGAIAGRGAMWGAIVTFTLRVCLPLLDTGSCTAIAMKTQTLVYDGLCYLDAGFFFQEFRMPGIGLLAQAWSLATNQRVEPQCFLCAAL